MLRIGQYDMYPLRIECLRYMQSYAGASLTPCTSTLRSQPARQSQITAPLGDWIAWPDGSQQVVDETVNLIQFIRGSAGSLIQKGFALAPSQWSALNDEPREVMHSEKMQDIVTCGEITVALATLGQPFTRAPFLVVTTKQSRRYLWIVESTKCFPNKLDNKKGEISR